MNDNNVQNDKYIQEYIDLSKAKAERDKIEELLDYYEENYNDEWNDSNNEYNELNNRLFMLYNKIVEIRKYLYNVSPSYREMFAENHEIDSVISVF